MSLNLKAVFDTRREAEMTVERLVQENGIERTDIFVTSDGDLNSSGEEVAGADAKGQAPSPAERDDAALNGRISVSVDINDEAKAERIRAAFSEFGAAQISG